MTSRSRKLLAFG